ncbi:DUF86 domain-containing protein [Candidatus Margulisiibacteriota bacterium]
MNKNLLYLLTILEAVEKIKFYTKDFKDAETFYSANMQKEFNAVLNLLIAIGEEAKKIENKIRSSEKEIDWESIVALRNELSHNYRGVDKDIIWDIIINYLDPLKKVCIEIVNRIEPDKNILFEVIGNEYYKNLQFLIKYD